MTKPTKKYPFGKKVVDELLLLGANDDFKSELDNFSKKFNPPADNDSGIDGKKKKNIRGQVPFSKCHNA